MKITNVLRHERSFTTVIDWPELSEIIEQAVRRETAYTIHNEATVKIRIVQCEEGSPSYRVDRWKAAVTIVEEQEQPETRP